jgi:hypothetical protein
MRQRWRLSAPNGKQKLKPFCVRFKKDEAKPENNLAFINSDSDFGLLSGFDLRVSAFSGLWQHAKRAGLF